MMIFRAVPPAALWLMLSVFAFAEDEHQLGTAAAGTLDLIEPSAFSGHIHVDWHSRYVSEGRDNLDGDGIASTTVELGWEDLTVAGWFADSPDADYQETNLSVLWTYDVADWNFYGGYTWLTFPQDGGHDHELGAGVGWKGLPAGISAALDAYFSMAATGTFLDLSVAREIKLTDHTSLEPTMGIGYNQGYVTDGHEGWNHYQYGLIWHWHGFDHCSIHAATTWTNAINRNPYRDPGDAALGSFAQLKCWIKWEF